MLDYLAPEQIEGRAADGRTDQYSLACAGFEFLCGTPPFGPDQGQTLMYAQIYADPPAASARRAGISAAVDSVLATALAKDPADRYPSCGRFAEELRCRAAACGQASQRTHRGRPRRAATAPSAGPAGLGRPGDPPCQTAAAARRGGRQAPQRSSRRGGPAGRSGLTGTGPRQSTGRRGGGPATSEPVTASQPVPSASYAGDPGGPDPERSARRIRPAGACWRPVPWSSWPPRSYPVSSCRGDRLPPTRPPPPPRRLPPRPPRRCHRRQRPHRRRRRSRLPSRRRP